MGLYEQSGMINLIPAIRQKFKMDLDGRVGIPSTMLLDNPWLDNGVDQERNCILWHYVFFREFNLIHTGCMDCWKTHYRPKTLRELFEIEKFQQEDSRAFVNIAAKCGTETRNFTGNLGGYAAFWYNPLGCGLAQARKNTHTLCEATGKDLQLKRGCTEMELFTLRNFGFGSDKWDELRTRHNAMLQELLEATFYIVEQSNGSPGVLKPDIHQRWIEYAAWHGDKTYLDFVDKPLVPKLVAYKGSIHNPKDFRGGTYGKDNHESVQSAQNRGSGGEQSEKVESLAGRGEPSRIETLA